MIDVEGPAYILGSMLAAVDERVIDLQLGNLPHRARDGNSSRFGQALNAFGKVDAITKYVAIFFVYYDLTEMHANSEHHSQLAVERVVEPRHALLNVDGRRDGGEDGSEFSQHGIARTVDQRAASDFDGRAQDLGLR